MRLYGQQADTLYFEPQYRHGIRYIITSTAGEEYVGFVKEETAHAVVLENRQTHEATTINRNAISSARVFSDRAYADRIMGENNHANSYLLTPSAFPFEEGCVTSRSHWLIIENFDYAITDNWAIDVGAVTFYPVSIGVKCAYKVGPGQYLGGNIFGLGNITGNKTANKLMMGYGGAARFTTGTSNKNITFAAGVLGLSSDIFHIAGAPGYMNTTFGSFSFCNRFSRKAALNIECWYLPETRSGLGGIGVKFVEDQSTCWTLGCFTFLNASENALKINLKTIPIPYFGLSRKFH
jgi:hypothetical protein